MGRVVREPAYTNTGAYWSEEFIFYMYSFRPCGVAAAAAPQVLSPSLQRFVIITWTVNNPFTRIHPNPPLSFCSYFASQDYQSPPCSSSFLPVIFVLHSYTSLLATAIRRIIFSRLRFLVLAHTHRYPCIFFISASESPSLGLLLLTAHYLFSNYWIFTIYITNIVLLKKYMFHYYISDG